MNKASKLLLLMLLPLQLLAQMDSTALKTPEGVAAKFLEFISFEKDEVKDWDESLAQRHQHPDKYGQKILKNS